MTKVHEQLLLYYIYTLL